MSEPDFLERLQAGREALAKFQKSLLRMAMPEDQRTALLDAIRTMLVPGEQLQTMVDLIDAFGPPLAQVEALRDEIAEQRAELEAIDKRLVHIEAAAERLATACEQLVMFQQPFVSVAETLTGQKVTRPDD